MYEQIDKFLKEQGVKLSNVARSENSLSLNIDFKVKTNSSIKKITIDSLGMISLSVTETPVDGEANRGIEKLISKLLGIPKRNIVFIRGSKSSKKTLRISFDFDKYKQEHYFLDKITRAIT